ncbi:MAG: tRNA lysidine(34) synthetase TilS [Mycoplasma sp.]|nr:tRNA lysidine(34) synthetase TilS [Mycoplasma sp.]
MYKIKLLGISGGPDSMFLLNKYKKQNIVVAHINHNERPNTIFDQNIVVDFCNENNIKYEILEVKDKHEKNFHDWARKKRYEFFKEIYIKYDCTQLVLAHHIDDFLETALMQVKSNKNPSFFGIRKKNTLYGMEIYRPFIDLWWKDEILDFVKKNDIKYVIDPTNDDQKYDRAKIRKELSELTHKEKKSRYSWFIKSNKILQKKNNKVNILMKMWAKKNFSVKSFSSMPFKNELIFKYIHDSIDNVKLSSKKIESIIDFILANNGGKKYVLNDENYLLIKNGKLLFNV